MADEKTVTQEEQEALQARMAEEERKKKEAEEAAKEAGGGIGGFFGNIWDGITGWAEDTFGGDGKGETEEGFDLNEKNGKRRDESAVGQGPSEELGGELTKNDDGTLHYSGSLGDFDYDASQWAVCLFEGDGHGREPALRYIGSETDGTQIDIPEGVKSLDHTFQGKDGLTSRPAIPESVASMNGAFDGCTGLSGATKTDIDASQGSDITAEGKIDSNEELFARETGIGTKSTEYDNIKYNLFESDGLTRSDQAAAGTGYNEALGGQITEGEDGKLKYSGYLGEFEYDPEVWAVGSRTTVTEDGYSATVPVLRYVGSNNLWDNTVDFATDGSEADRVRIPQGVKVLDFAFEGNESITEVPVIPDGVESAHCAFANCKKLSKACEAAKDAEHQGELVGALGGAAGGAAGGFLGGAAAAAWIPIPGARIVGGVIGGAVGAFGGWKAGHSQDGKGGDWYLPSSLKDTSYMFDNCGKLTEAAQFADDSNLMNTQGMYRDNESLGSDPIANKYGSKSISNLTGTLVTTDANSHMYEGTNTDYVMDPETAEKSSSKYWNDKEGKFEDGVYQTHDKEDVQAAENLSTNLEVEAVLDKDVVTDMDVATGGAASSGFYYDRNGEKVETTDANAENQVDKGATSGLGGIMSLLDRGVISFAEYKLLGMFTGASKGIGGKLLAAGGTFLLQTGNILPRSIKPVLEGVANMVGPESQIGGLINGVADMLPDVGDDSLVAKALGTAQEPGAGEHAEKIDVLTDEQKAQKDASDKTIGSVSDRMEMVLDNPFGADSDEKLSILDGEKINGYMAVNARQMAQDNIFLTVANKNVRDGELGEMGAMMELSGDALEEKAALWAEQDGGQLSEEHRKELSEAYIKMMEGLDAYDNAAAEEMRILYADDPEKLAQGMNGLGKVMSATVVPTVSSMMEMQAQYGIFTEEDLQRLDELQFAGVEGSALDYQEGELTMSEQEAAGWQATHGDQQDEPTEDASAQAPAEPVPEDPEPEAVHEPEAEPEADYQAEDKAEYAESDHTQQMSPEDTRPAGAERMADNSVAASFADKDVEVVTGDEPEADDGDQPDEGLLDKVMHGAAVVGTALGLKNLMDRGDDSQKISAGREGVYTEEQLEAMGKKEPEPDYLPGKIGRRMAMMSEE